VLSACQKSPSDFFDCAEKPPKNAQSFLRILEKASETRLFVVGDQIEAGLCPLKLPRCLLVFPADSLVF